MKLRIAVLVALATGFVSSGCIVVKPPEPVVVVKQTGPPPHAPAHGYRHKHGSGVKLRFDTSLGAYRVVRYEGVFFHDGWFVRIHKGVWQVSATVSGPWHAKRVAWVPKGLRASYHAKKKYKKHHKKHYPAKGGW